jgi:CHAT domain-containing protein
MKGVGDVSRRTVAVIARLIAPFMLFLSYCALATPASSASLHRQSATEKLAFVQKPEPQVQQGSVPRLEVGKPVERQMAAGETHGYAVPLTAGQYVQVLVDQRGVDVAVSMIAPDGQKLAAMDSPNSTQGPEIVSVIAEQSGPYRVEISSSKNVPTGRYEVRIEAIHLADAQDRKRVAAQGAYFEGKRLQRQGTAESRKEAIQQYEEALENWRATGEKIMEIHALSLEASTHWQLGQLQRALELYNRALEVSQSAKDRREEAATRSSVAVLYGDMGRPQEARNYYEQVLKLWEEIGDVFLTAKSHNNLGFAYALLGEPRKALEHYNAALSVWQEIGNHEQEAFTVHNIGGVYEVLGDTQEALDHYAQSLALFRSVGNRGGEADDLNSIGNTYKLTGEFQKALEFFNQALALWRTTGNRPRQALVLNNIGDAHAALGDPKNALENYDRALILWRDVGDHRFEALTLERIGTLHAAASEPQKALEYYEQALALRRAAADPWGEASVLSSTGFVHTSTGAPQKALEYFTQALRLYLDIGDRRGEARTRFGIARGERDRGNLTDARNQIETALTLTEAVRADVNSSQLRATYLATVENYFEFYVDLLMRLDQKRPSEGFAALALQTSERARARSLLEMLTEARVNIREGVDAALLNRERTLVQLLNAKAQRQVQLLGQKNTGVQLAALTKEISEIEDQYQQVQAAIRKSSPAYAALTQPQPLGLKEIQAQLDQGTMLLEYSLGEERSYVWAVTQNSLKTYELPKRAQIEKAARRVYDLLTARSQSKAGEDAQTKQERIAQADSQLMNASAELSQMVLGPIGSELGAERLVIVADGALQYVPFAALSVVNSQPSVAQPGRTNSEPATIYRSLIQDHEIISLPSASALAVQREGLRNRKPAPNAVAVIADPVFSAADERLGALAKTGAVKQVQGDSSANTRIIEHLADDSGLVIRRLKYTRQEADQILAEAPRAKTLRAIDFKANRATATGGELSKYRYVHFATHGYIDSERPGLSAIVLSLVDEKGSPQDGFLRANEIYNLNLPAELVVLSACETGLGKEIKGEGLVGLTQGFMYAGARRVVVSLWNVNDKATAELMARFYRGMLKENKTPAAALRTAQMEMSRQKQWQSPYYWAAFVLQGEWK